ncbi:MAG: SNF2-related protein, partial [Tateyamaria sp.]|uniref:SNF2-related protein n=1 Tax=Tateyamaria sp. TaxID=1929288 RepID=UPI0032DE2540
MYSVQDSILIVESEGNRIVPSADQVFRSVIELDQVWVDVPPGALDMPDGLEFSRFPASPELFLTLSSDKKTPLLEIRYRFRGADLAVAGLQPLKAGHIVAGNKWYPLHTGAAAEVLSLIEKCRVSAGPISSLSAFLALKKAAKEEQPVTDDTQDAEINVLFMVPRGRSTPKGIDANLYPYQTAGWQWLQFIVAERVGGLLADEMGLGKTLQVISVVSDHGDVPLGITLVAAPGSLLENWYREFSRFAPELKVHKHHGPYRTGRYLDLLVNDVVITSYETIVRDLSMLSMIEWG